MFAYCGNNPISRVDRDGNAFETVVDVITLVVSVADVAANLTDVWAWIGLVGDLVDLIPFITGVGEATKSLRVVVVIEKVVDGFGDLSRAKEFGIKTYTALRSMLKGTGLQAHHIIEQRFFRHIRDFDLGAILSVAVTAAEHQKFTNEWRKWFKYGTNYAELDINDIWKAAQSIYQDYPELLEAAKKILFS